MSSQYNWSLLDFAHILFCAEVLHHLSIGSYFQCWQCFKSFSWVLTVHGAFSSGLDLSNWITKIILIGLSFQIVLVSLCILQLGSNTVIGSLIRCRAWTKTMNYVCDGKGLWIFWVLIWLRTALSLKIPVEQNTSDLTEHSCWDMKHLCLKKQAMLFQVRVSWHVRGINKK